MDAGKTTAATRTQQLYGDDGVRTRDLVVANHALSQLGYIPGLPLPAVGVLGFEPRTSALSELRSSQLSYTPSLSTLSTASHAETKKPNLIGLALSETSGKGIERQSASRMRIVGDIVPFLCNTVVIVIIRRITEPSTETGRASEARMDPTRDQCEPRTGGV